METTPPQSQLQPPPQNQILNQNQTQQQQESVDSSPRSRKSESWDDHPQPVNNNNNNNLGSKIRLMCSYGGHIVPRPHDKSLCYVGGDTRMVVVDRNTTLADLSSRLSKTLIHGQSFTLKYQLPNEDLDSLISVTTDEDLDNMIDEYDRIFSNNSAVKLFRIRLFLFPTKPESTSSSIGPILDSTNSDDWFLGALNGVNGVLNRGFSDSQSVDCLLGLENEGGIGGSGGGNSGNDGSQIDFNGGGGGNGGDVSGGLKNAKQGGQDVHSVPDSPMVDTYSSFGSTSSSPPLVNLPPIRVHVQDNSGISSGGLAARDRVSEQKAGIEEQFANMNVTTTTTASAIAQKRQDEAFVGISSPPPPMPTTIIAAATGISNAPLSIPGGGSEYQNRVYSDDERSDRGVPLGYGRAQPQQAQLPTMIQTTTLPLQPQQTPSCGGVEVTLPDSVSSDSSFTNAMYRQKPMFYQEPVVQVPSSRVPANQMDQKLNFSDPNTRVQIQQARESGGYMMQPQAEQQLQQQQQQQLLQQQQQQQLLQQLQQQQQQQQHQQQQQQHQQQQRQFVQAGGQYIQHQPVSSYYQVYPSQQQQQRPQLDQQYPVYYMPSNLAQQSYVSMQQPTYSEPIQTANYPTRSQAPPPTATMINAAPTYPPNRTAPQPRPTPASPLIQVAPTPNQHQQQQQHYVGYSQVHHPSQSISPNAGPTANYAYEYADPSHAQVYYTQPYAPSLAAQYQTMTATSAPGLSEASSQPAVDQMKQQLKNPQAI